jgi:glycosyltransferase involved in cell wall biosynthesis
MSTNNPTPAVKPEPRKLLVTGLYSPGSGLTNVVSVLMRELRGQFSLQGLGFQPGIIRRHDDVEVSGCPMHVQSSSLSVFMSDPAWLETYMKNSRPEGVIVTGPAFLTTPFLRQLQKYRPHVKILLYLPVEGELVNEDIHKTLDLVDACILYTEYSRKNVAEICSRAAQNEDVFRMPRLYVAGHGVDSSDFFPLRGNSQELFFDESRAAAKRLLFSDKPELHNAFIVLNANCGYLRKRLDLTIAGFAEFAASRPDSYLYLHTGRTSDKQLAELRTHIDNSGVGERILLNALNPDMSRLSIEKLNLLYNTCDVGLTTAMGEGWGLVSFEHAATGAPQIVPGHTSFTENWSGAAEMLPVTGRQHIFYEFADMFTVSPGDVARGLERLYSDHKYRREMAHAAYRRSQEPRFKWPAIGRNFKDLLDEVIAKPAFHTAIEI